MRLIALGFSCNNACVFCAQGELRASEEDVSGAERIDNLIHSIEPGETVAFVGGEPTIHERLPGWIASVEARGASRVLVQTNGRRLAYRSYARALRDASSRLALDVSLHGSSEAMHDYHTASQGSFRQTILGLNHARLEGIERAVTTVVTRSNFRHLAEIVAVAARVGASAVRFAPAEAYGSAARAADRVIPAWELVKPYLAHAVTEARRAGLGVQLGDVASSPEVQGSFAGMDRVEEVEPVERARRPEASDATDVAPRRVSLAVLGRPVPAKNEVRAHARQTGDDLRAIFPSLFGAAGGAG